MRHPETRPTQKHDIVGAPALFRLKSPRRGAKCMAGCQVCRQCLITERDRVAVFEYAIDVLLSGFRARRRLEQRYVLAHHHDRGTRLLSHGRIGRHVICVRMTAEHNPDVRAPEPRSSTDRRSNGNVSW